MEEWRAIPGWEGFYEVSSLGRIRSIERMSRVNSVMPHGRRRMGGIIRKQTENRPGYRFVSLTAEGKRKVMAIHRAVLLAFAGEPKKGQVCRHLDGDPSNNMAQNLCWGTHLENMQDRQTHGKYAFGENHHAAKLTNEQALYAYQSDECGTELAKRFGASPTKISDIRRGRTFKKVTGGKPLPRKNPAGRRKTDKMSMEKARQARKMRMGGAGLQEIANMFGITVSTMSSLCAGKTWKE